MRFSLSSLTPPQRARLAVAALLLVSGSNLYMVTDLAQLWRPADENDREPGPYIEQLAPLQRLLPFDAHIGYVNPTLQIDSAIKLDLFLTRYALAPRCIAQGTEFPLLLVWGDTPAAVDLGAGRRLLSDLGNGFRLYRRDASP